MSTNFLKLVPGLFDLVEKYPTADLLTNLNSDFTKYTPPSPSPPYIETYSGEFEFRIETEYINCISLFNFIVIMFLVFFLVANILKWKKVEVSVVE